MRNAFAGLNYRLGTMNIFEKLQPLLHTLILMDANQDCYSTSALSQHHRTPSLVYLLHK